MQNYIIVGLIITVVVIIIMKNDLINLNSLTGTDNNKTKMKKMLQSKIKDFKNKNKIKKKTKIKISESSEILDDSSEDPFSDLSSSSDSSDDETESNDDTEMSFDSSDKKSNVNNKLLNDFKKFIMQKKNKSNNKQKIKTELKNELKNKVKNKTKNKLKIKSNEIKQEDIQKMHKLAKELNKKKIIELAKQHPTQSAKIVEEPRVNTTNNANTSNYDLTDTINRIIQMELQNN
jgi:hypothetical protein